MAEEHQRTESRPGGGRSALASSNCPPNVTR